MHVDTTKGILNPSASLYLSHHIQKHLWSAVITELKFIVTQKSSLTLARTKLNNLLLN